METIFNLFDDSDWIEAQEYPKGTKKKVLHAFESKHGSLVIVIWFPYKSDK